MNYSIANASFGILMIYTCNKYVTCSPGAGFTTPLRLTKARFSEFS